MGTLIKVFSLTFVLSCGRNLPVTKRERFLNFDFIESKSLDGEIQLINGKNVNLQSESSRAGILIFASDSCITCKEEASALIKLFEENGSTPKNVFFYTVMLGGYIEDAQDEVDNLGITWDVGVNQNDVLFDKYCPPPNNLTPCVVAFNPNEGGYARFVGHSSFDEWQEVTKKWQY